MKFGYFDDDKREYVITTPKTPLPWINYLGCNDFFTLMSNTSGGYSFDGDAAVYINNTAATVVSNTGTSLTARSHEYTPDAYQEQIVSQAVKDDLILGEPLFQIR